MIYRRPCAAIMENGETLVVSTEFLTKTESPYSLQAAYEKATDKEAFLRVQNPNQEHYPAGTRILQITSTCQRDASRVNTPVLVVSEPGAGGGARPVPVTYLEAITDPTFLYDPRSGVCHVFYWVNGWSTDYSTHPAGIGDQLFPGVDPPDPTHVGVLSPPPPSPATTKEPKSGLVTRVRDLPSINSPERVGTLDLSSFWVAPWTEAFLYRHVPELIPNYDLYLSPPPPPSTSPPSPPSTRGLEWVIPQTPEIKEVVAALKKRDAGGTLTNSEKSVLENYDKAPQRLAALSRTTRVLLHAIGKLEKLRRIEEGKPTQDCHLYLVLDHPQAVMAFPRGLNKIMFSRMKWSSFVGGQKVFVTGELGYRYPSPVSSMVLNSMPQVDFTVWCPHHGFDEIGRAGSLPETTVAQAPPFIPAATMLFPVGFPVNLVEALLASG